MSAAGAPGALSHVACILALGSINADFQVRVDRRPDVSETLIAHDFTRLGGGKSANVAWLARRLGAPARLFGRVGDDDLAEQALASLREIGVDLAEVRPAAGAGTGVAMIAVPPDGKKGIVMAPNANEAWNDGDALRTAAAIVQAPPGSVLVTNAEVPAAVVERAMRAARERGLTTVLDPSPPDRVTDALLALADVVTPNAGEAQRLTGVECRDAASGIDAGRRLLARGAAAAAVKLPDGGCVLVAPEETVHVAPVPVEVVDTTGAGDAFAGALAVALLKRRPRAEAIRFAVAASHAAVTGYGSRPAALARDGITSIEARLGMERRDVERQA